MSTASSRRKEFSPKRRVALLSKYDRAGASSRHRTYNVLDHLDGWDVLAFPLFDESCLQGLYQQGRRRFHRLAISYLQRVRDCLRLPARRPHAVVIEKELLPWVPWWLERFLWPDRIPLLVDYDDAIYARYVRRPFLHDKIQCVMTRADAVVCGNRILAGVARQYQTKVHILPTTLDCARYTHCPPRAKDSSSNLRLGWIGTPVTQTFVEMLLPVIDQVQEELPLHLTMIGAAASQQLTRRHYVELVPWSAEVERSLGSYFDVGIMPLPDRPFERGKCGFKIIQYGACSLPTVASRVGANADIVRDGETGFLVQSPEEWQAAFRRLAADRDVLRQMGMAARKHVESNYDLSLAVAFWRRLLEDSIV